MAPAFEDQFEMPFKQPLADYGWEDGLQISPDGLNLYALYSPADLFSWINYITLNIGLPVCTTFGNMDFLRSYANDYGMDLATNLFGCDSALNIDILYAHKNSIDEEFLNWALSGIARPALIEGGPFPLFSESETDVVDHFLFTGNSDIWMLNHTGINPSEINTAIRLPTPINPVTDEFNADNPVLKRINGSDTLLLLYEKYTVSDLRNFMYCLSFDDGFTWEIPVQINTINNDAGHIEHPQLFTDADGTWLYYSLNYDIWRSKQGVENNWDSWINAEPVILKGNALSIGEPSLTASGDISFLVAYQNISATDPYDQFDCDPWFVKKKNMGDAVKDVGDNSLFSISPNPTSGTIIISAQINNTIELLTITNLSGTVVYKIENITGKTSMNLESMHPGMYLIELQFAGGLRQIKKLILY